MKKRAIRYLRFSNKKQSNGSIERQEIVTDHWLKSNDVELTDTFKDEGKSAKDFDRPDFIKLEAFIKRHHTKVEYLVVDQFDRFARQAGEGISKVVALQKKYSIQIVSVTEGIIFDYETPGNLLRAGLQLLLAEEDNIQRSVKVRSGMYAARTTGRFVNRIAPFGYTKKTEPGENSKKSKITLELNVEEAKIVEMIYDMYLRDIPLNLIKTKARELGFLRKGNMAVERILSNPIYAGMQYAKPFKEHVGGLFPTFNEKIITANVWHAVQGKIHKPEKPRMSIDPNLPLRGVLKCHCGNPISGAPSKGKSSWFYYYKCKHTGHNNISAIKSHNQLLTAWELMSVPKQIITSIKLGSESAIQNEMKQNLVQSRSTKLELERCQEDLYSLEEKWIRNEVTHDTYQRFYTIYSDKITVMREKIERCTTDTQGVYKIFNKNLDYLTDLRYVYENMEVLEKRELVKLVFDSNLYYENGVYRTPTMLEILSHNHLKMKEQNVLIYQKKGDNFSVIPHSGE